MSQTNAADAERLALAEAWIAQDPDPETRAELAALVEGARAGDAAAPPSSPTASTRASPSAPPGSAARSPPAPTA